MDSLTLSLPFPPSVNTYWRAPNNGPLKGRHLVSAQGRAYQTAAQASVISQLRRIPRALTGPLSVNVALYPPDRRRRDLDNYNKALFDALTRVGIWEDDSQIRRLFLEWGPVVPTGKVVITISNLIQEGVCAPS